MVIFTRIVLAVAAVFAAGAGFAAAQTSSDKERLTASPEPAAPPVAVDAVDDAAAETSMLEESVRLARTASLDKAALRAAWPAEDFERIPPPASPDRKRR